MNDLESGLETYAGKMMIEGGWDTQEPASLLGVTVEQIREETQRCLQDCRKPGFVLCPILLNERGNSIVVGDDRLFAAVEEWEKLCMF